jgi:hypothetical protein
MKWPVVGMAMELFGIANLFGNFFPVIVAFLKKIPFLGPCLQHKYVKPVIDKLAGESSFIIGED